MLAEYNWRLLFFLWISPVVFSSTLGASSQCSTMNEPELYARSSSLQFEDNKFLLEKYLKHIKFKKESLSILDIGVGDAYTTLNLLIPQIPRKLDELIGIDRSEKMIEYATNICPQSNVTFIQMDIGNDEIPPGFYQRFDHAFSFFCLHWVLNKRMAFRNIFNMLGANGDFLAFIVHKSGVWDAYVKVSMHSRWHSHFPKDLVYCFQGINNQEIVTNEVLKETGFPNYFCKVEKRSNLFSSYAHFRQFITAIDPIVSKLNEDERIEYLTDLIEEITKCGGVIFSQNKNSNTEELVANYEVLVVYGSKI